jgi:hypothetical protein
MLYSLKFVGSDQGSAIPVLDFKERTVSGQDKYFLSLGQDRTEI